MSSTQNSTAHPNIVSPYQFEKTPRNIIIRNTKKLDYDSKWCAFSLPGKYFAQNKIASKNHVRLTGLVNKINALLETANIQDTLIQNAETLRNHHKISSLCKEARQYEAKKQFGVIEQHFRNMLVELDFILSSGRLVNDDVTEEDIIRSILPESLPIKILEDHNDKYLGAIHLTEDGREERDLLDLELNWLNTLFRPRLILAGLTKLLNEADELAIYLPQEDTDDMQRSNMNKQAFEAYLRSEIFNNPENISSFVERYVKELQLLDSLNVDYEKMMEELDNLQEEVGRQQESECINEYEYDPANLLSERLANIINRHCQPTLESIHNQVLEAIANWYVETPTQARISLTDHTIKALAAEVLGSKIRLDQISSSLIQRTIEQERVKLEARANKKSTFAHMNGMNNLKGFVESSLQGQIKKEQQEIKALLEEIATYQVLPNSDNPAPEMFITLDFTSKQISSKRISLLLTNYLPKGQIILKSGTAVLPDLSALETPLHEKLTSRICGLEIQTQAQLNAFSENMSQFTHLEELHISNLTVTPEFMQLTSSLEKLSSLTFQKCTFSSSPVCFEKLNLSRLEKLSLEESEINNEDLAYLQQQISTRSSNRPLAIKLNGCPQISEAALLSLLNQNGPAKAVYQHPFFAQHRLRSI